MQRPVGVYPGKVHPAAEAATVTVAPPQPAPSVVTEAGHWFVYSRRSLERISLAGTPSTSASATLASAPCRTRPWTSASVVPPNVVCSSSRRVQDKDLRPCELDHTRPPPEGCKARRDSGCGDVSVTSEGGVTRRRDGQRWT